MAEFAFYFVASFSAFLLGLTIFMYFEGRKIGDNQYRVLLLPPPASQAQETVASLPELWAVSRDTQAALQAAAMDWPQEKIDLEKAA